MKRLLLSLCLLGPIFATNSGAETPALIEARKALSEKIPQVAEQKLRALLSEKDIAALDLHAARELLAQALLDSGKHDEALEIVKLLNPTAENAVLRANIHVALGRWEEALPLYQQGIPETSARVGEAEALQALGRTTEAVGLLEVLVKSNIGGNPLRLRLASLLTEVKRLPEAQEILNKVRAVDAEEQRWKLYVDARILLAQGHADPARKTFLQVLGDRERLPDALLFGATLGLTEALIILEGKESADKELETFIWRYPQSTYLEAAFRKLDQIYAEEENPQEEQLHKWAQKPEVRRAALALFYVARLQLREQKHEKLALSLNIFIERAEREKSERARGEREGSQAAGAYATYPLLCEVYLMQADLHLALNRFSRAVSALEAAMREVQSVELRADIELRTGLAHFQQGEFLLAANLFRTAAERSERLRSVATFNAALAWLNQGNEERFLQEYQALGKVPQEQRLRSELLLEQGLFQARASDLRTEETLQLFLHEFPRHGREAEARLALAELAFRRLTASAVPPLHGAAQAAEYLRVANAAPQTPQTEENSEYLAIFIADAKQPRSDGDVIDLARTFLRERPTSTLVPEVQMKLGQVYYRREDFANAETQFIGLVQSTPKSPYAESALFLAGQCATKLRAEDRALAYFKQVVDLNGPLKLYARQEQAMAQTRLGEEAEAVRLYDLILAGTPDPELQAAALCGKADNLASLGKKKRDRLEEAIAVYDQLAAGAAVTPAWRNQALYKKAKALQKLGRTNEAITSFYDVLEKSASAGREYFWSYKAGFDAAALFEEKEQWTAAIGVYRKMALLSGPRTEEVRDRIKKLELDHFIVWD